MQSSAEVGTAYLNNLPPPLPPPPHLPPEQVRSLTPPWSLCY